VIVGRAEVEDAARFEGGEVGEEIVLSGAGQGPDALVPRALPRARGARDDGAVHVHGIRGVLHGYGHARADEGLHAADVALGAVGDEDFLGGHDAVIKDLGDFGPERAEALFVTVAGIALLGAEGLHFVDEAGDDGGRKGFGGVADAEGDDFGAGALGDEFPPALCDLREKVACLEVCEIGIPADHKCLLKRGAQSERSNERRSRLKP